MSHLNDPNTHRLATNCIMCKLPLRDARSVTIGIGPICRKNMGYDDIMSGVSEEARTATNKLIHKAGIAMDSDDIDTILECADAIEALDLSKIATIIRQRFIPIRLERAENVQVYGWTHGRGEFAIEGQTRNVIKLFTPYNPDLNSERKNMRLRMRPVKVGKSFHWEAGEEQGGDVLELLSRVFPGRKALGSKGVFVIPVEAAKRAAAGGA